MTMISIVGCLPSNMLMIFLIVLVLSVVDSFRMGSNIALKTQVHNVAKSSTALNAHAKKVLV
jgi:hypothetical protein